MRGRSGVADHYLARLTFETIAERLVGGEGLKDRTKRTFGLHKGIQALLSTASGGRCFHRNLQLQQGRLHHPVMDVAFLALREVVCLRLLVNHVAKHVRERGGLNFKVCLHVWLAGFLPRTVWFY